MLELKGGERRTRKEKGFGVRLQFRVVMKGDGVSNCHSRRVGLTEESFETSI